ncbi:hypothetical protein ACIA03_27385 [Nocardioides sp. NPDC051685]|uniref:hypothetical protein n=1 Tax=Nocardioides sp. NPDC051685 TaxID=3364334 RepID=UPI0037913B31
MNLTFTYINFLDLGGKEMKLRIAVGAFVAAAALAVTYPGAAVAADFGPAVYPGTVTANVTYNAGDLTLTYSANANGWASTGTTCIDWVLEYKDFGISSWKTVDSGTKCGKRTVSTPTFSRYCPAMGNWRMSAHASGPGGSDKDAKTKEVS